MAPWKSSTKARVLAIGRPIGGGIGVAATHAQVATTLDSEGP
jgi:hypothetical protein